MKNGYKFDHGEVVVIKKYRDDPINHKGRIAGMRRFTDGEKVMIKYWVTNMNMPFCGSVSDFFYENELEKRV